MQRKIDKLYDNIWVVLQPCGHAEKRIGNQVGSRADMDAKEARKLTEIAKKNRQTSWQHMGCLTAMWSRRETGRKPGGPQSRYGRKGGEKTDGNCKETSRTSNPWQVIALADVTCIPRDNVFLTVHHELTIYWLPTWFTNYYLFIK